MMPPITLGLLAQYRRGELPLPEPEQPWPQRAIDVVQGPRNASYGHILMNFLDLAIRDTMNKIRRGKIPYGQIIDLEDLIIFFDTHKIVREANLHDDDNYVDIMGYSFSWQRIDVAMKALGFDEGMKWFEGKRLWELVFLFEELNTSKEIGEGPKDGR